MEKNSLQVSRKVFWKGEQQVTFFMSLRVKGNFGNRLTDVRRTLKKMLNFESSFIYILSMEAHSHNPYMQEAEAGGLL